MNKILVIHHSADNDGNLSGLVVKHFHKNDDVTLYGFDYGQKFPEDMLHLFDKVYMVDISDDVLLTHPEIIWIDHHKTAIEKYPSNQPGLRIDGVAACRLCWQFFARKDAPTKQEFVDRTLSEPYFIQLAGEYDIWDKRNPEAELFNIGTQTHDINAVFDICLTDRNGYYQYVASGSVIRNWQNKMNASICKHNVHTVVLHGLTFACLNTARGNSLTFQGLEDKYDAYMMWRYDGTKVTVSLYHAPGHEQHDLSEIAKEFKGGGHRGACGFQLSLNELQKLIA